MDKKYCPGGFISTVLVAHITHMGKVYIPQVKTPRGSLYYVELEEQQRKARIHKNKQRRQMGISYLPTGYVPEEVLRRGGYRLLTQNRGWRRPFIATTSAQLSNVRDFSFHAFVLPDGRIEIHTDQKTERTRRGGHHLASNIGVKEEIRRLKKQGLQVVVSKPNPPRVSKRAKDILPHKQYLEAMQALRASPPVPEVIHRPSIARKKWVKMLVDEIRIYGTMVIGMWRKGG